VNYEDAESTLNVIFAGATGLWLASAALVRLVARKCEDPIVEQFTLQQELPDVTRSFAQQLAGLQNATPLANTRIESMTDDELVWTSGQRRRYPGKLTVDPDNRTRLSVTIDSTNVLRGARIALTIGLILTIAIYVALRTWALPHEHGAVRGQVFQMVQAIHGLWPPFLFAFMALFVRRKLRDDVKRIVNNLAFL